MMRLLLITLGSVFLGLGFLGIFTPGLPTTPFLLLAAGCYFRSSDRLYSWILQHRLFGKYIHAYRKTRSIPFSSKIISLVIMWIMTALSVTLFIQDVPLKIIITILGVTGTVVMLSIPTSGKE